MAKKTTSVASRLLWNRFYKNRPKEIARLEQTIEDMKLGAKIRDLRVAAGLSQKELAGRIGTQPSAISRIEDADYEGHSVETLRKIAKALQSRLEISFVPDRRQLQRTA